jgi:hypothetical protein
MGLWKFEVGFNKDSTNAVQPAILGQSKLGGKLDATILAGLNRLKVHHHFFLCCGYRI